MPWDKAEKDRRYKLAKDIANAVNNHNNALALDLIQAFYERAWQAGWDANNEYS